MYYLYILRCADSTLYCGQTNDIKRRLDEHNNKKKGAKYTKSRRPVELIYFEEHPTIQQVLKRELQVKRYSKAKKEKLVQVEVLA